MNQSDRLAACKTAYNAKIQKLEKLKASGKLSADAIAMLSDAIAREYHLCLQLAKRD